MKFMQVHTFYYKYLESFYGHNATLAQKSFDDQIRALICDGFSASHIIAPYLDTQKYESYFVVANNAPSQFQWLAESGTGLNDPANWVYAIVKQQIEEIKPDVLYLSDPITFDSKFVRSLSYKPKLILGWRAAVIPEGTDWSEFDVMLSGLKSLRNFALKLGAKHAERYFPGYPVWINDVVEEVPPAYDVSFCGQWSTGLHSKRGELLCHIAADSRQYGYSAGYYLSEMSDKLPVEMMPFNLGERFGLDMHRALMSGKILFDSRATHLAKDPTTGGVYDLCGNETSNMRIIEATGCGRLLLTEQFSNLSDYFDVGSEIETFASKDELLEKIKYYVAHPGAREEIARRGQLRCLRDYSMEKRAEEFDGIITAYLQRSSAAPLRKSQGEILKESARIALEENRVQDAFQILIKVKALKEPTRDADLLRAHCFLRSNSSGAALQALLEELRFFPDNDEARQLYQSLAQKQSTLEGLDNEEFKELLSRIRPYSMLGESRLYTLYRLARHVCEEDIPGNFVECGVAAGGSSALLAYVISKYSKRQRYMYSFDSFEGMPEPTAHDSIMGMDAESTGWGTGTCAAPETSLQEIAEKLGVWHIIRPVKGYFEHTLAPMRNEVNQIGFIHMDADWYESIKTILENFYGIMADGALAQLDDYGYWEGCSKALHEFEAAHGLVFKLTSIDGAAVWFQKPEPAIAPDGSAEGDKGDSGKKSDALRIVQLCTSTHGGAGKAAYRLHHGLCEAGLDATFLCLSNGIPDPTVKVIHEATTSPEPGFAKIINSNNDRWQHIVLDHPQRPAGLEMFSDADSAVRLAGLEEIRSADIVHLHWVAGLVDYDEMSTALAGKKVVWTLHDMNAFTGGCHYAGDCLKYQTSCGACPQLGSMDNNDLSSAIWNKKNRALAGLDITVVTPSRWLAKCAMQSAIFRNSRVICIPNGVPVDVFKPHDRMEIRRALKISPTAKVVLFGADDLANSRKGFAYLLEALHRYRAKEDREIVLATFGSLHPSITINSPYPLFQCGSIHDETYLAYIYGMADVLVIPSIEDNLPNTVVEAMACGTPVVGFSIGGIPDMVEHEKTGYLAAKGNVDELMAGMEWVLFAADSDLLRHNCLQNAAQLYSIPTHTERFRILYQSLCASR